jgi:hypothetical protein
MSRTAKETGLLTSRFGATSFRGAWDMNDFISRVTAVISDR